MIIRPDRDNQSIQRPEGPSLSLAPNKVSQVTERFFSTLENKYANSQSSLKGGLIKSGRGLAELEQRVSECAVDLALLVGIPDSVSANRDRIVALMTDRLTQYLVELDRQPLLDIKATEGITAVDALKERIQTVLVQLQLTLMRDHEDAALYPITDAREDLVDMRPCFDPAPLRHALAHVAKLKALNSAPAELQIEISQDIEHVNSIIDDYVAEWQAAANAEAKELAAQLRLAQDHDDSDQLWKCAEQAFLLKQAAQTLKEMAPESAEFSILDKDLQAILTPFQKTFIDTGCYDADLPRLPKIEFQVAVEKFKEGISDLLILVPLQRRLIRLDILADAIGNTKLKTEIETISKQLLESLGAETMSQLNTLTFEALQSSAPFLSREKKSREKEKNRIQASMQGWSDRSKKLLGMFHLLLQGGTWLQEATQLPRRAQQLIQEAESAARDLQNALKPAQSRDLGFIGTVLSDKLPSVARMSSEEFMAFTARYPQTRFVIEKIRQDYRAGSIKAATPQQIFTAQREYLTSQAASPSLRQTFTIWMRDFMSDSAEAPRSQVQKATSSAPEMNQDLTAIYKNFEKSIAAGDWAALQDMLYTTGVEQLGYKGLRIFLGELEKGINKPLKALSTRYLDVPAHVINERRWLVDAVIEGNEAAVQFLLERGADPSLNPTSTLSGPINQSPLQAAIGVGSPKIIELLLEYAVDVHPSTVQKGVESPNPAIQQLFSLPSAVLTMSSGELEHYLENMPVLYHSLLSEQVYEIPVENMKALIQKDPSLTDLFLTELIKADEIERMKMILREYPETVNANHIKLAIERYYYSRNTRTLLETVDLDRYIDSYGYSPLHCAVYSLGYSTDDFGLDQRRLIFNTTLNHTKEHANPDVHGQGVLHWAVNAPYHSVEMVKRLLPYLNTKQINAPDHNGKSPLDWVIQSDPSVRKELTELLVQYGATSREQQPQQEQPSSWFASLIKSAKTTYEVALNYVLGTGSIESAMIGPLVREAWAGSARSTYDSAMRTVAQAITSDPQKLVSDIRRVILLGHVWELSGNYYFGESVGFLGLEGATAHIHRPFMLQNIEAVSARYPVIMTPDQKELLTLALHNAVEPSTEKFEPDKLVDKVRQGQPIIIQSGWTGHAIAFFFFTDAAGSYLGYCNRGSGTEKPIDLYKIDPAKINVRNLELFHHRQWREDFLEDWPKILAKFGAYKDQAVCEVLEEMIPIRPEQEVGNCSWESTETALFGLLAVKKLLETPGSNSGARLAEAYETYQAFIQSAKVEILAQVLAEHEKDPKNPTQALDAPTFQNLFRKELHELAESSPSLTSALKETSQTDPYAVVAALLKEESHCRYNQYMTEKVCRGLGLPRAMPEWRQDMEQRYAALKLRYYRQETSAGWVISTIKSVGQLEAYTKEVARLIRAEPV